MDDIYKKLEETDALILATPIYFFDITAQAKTLIDRLYSYFMNEKYTELFSQKKVAIIATNGGAPVEAFMSSLETQMVAFQTVGFETGDILVLGDNNIPGAIKEKEDQLAQAKELGENLI